MQGKVEIFFLPDGESSLVDQGKSVRDAAVEAGIALATPCGGHGVCHRCRVRLLSGEVEGEPDADGYHLACGTFPLSDCVVEVPEFSRALAPLAIVQAAVREIELDPPALEGIPPGNPLRQSAFGVACDIGTATVAAALVRLETGEVAFLSASGNPQSKHGEDVISRITRASSPDGLAELQRLILGCMGELITELCEQAEVERDAILDIVAAGNATMTHLLLGVSPATLGKAPYRPAFLAHEPVPLTDLGLVGHPSARLRVLPNIAGFIGGDTVAGILSTGLHRSDSLKLFVDIGANGEIVLGDTRRLVACSTAAGPAFEGGHIRRGMRAEPGAIDHVHIDDDVGIGTIGNAKPRGICGTGLIEAVAGMLSKGIIDENGRFVQPENAGGIPEALAGRLGGIGASRKLVLWAGNGDEIALTQEDISELQLAKAAIRAGVEVLLGERDSSREDIDEVLLAGAFGQFLRARDVLRIGLLPPVEEEKIRFVGNTALEGALRVLLSSPHTKEVADIADSTEFVDLAARPDFHAAFVSAMKFPAARG